MGQTSDNKSTGYLATKLFVQLFITGVLLIVIWTAFCGVIDIYWKYQGQECSDYSILLKMETEFTKDKICMITIDGQQVSLDSYLEYTGGK